MTDEQLFEAFELTTISNKDFHHYDHVRVGFLYMSRFSGLEGMRRFSEGLAKLAVASGKPHLYHETITWAFLLLIRERLVRARRADGRFPNWEEFVANNNDLLERNNSILKEYYTEQTLNSDFARGTFVLPDRRPRTL